jgi:hypothetical protein
VSRKPARTLSSGDQAAFHNFGYSFSRESSVEHMTVLVHGAENRALTERCLVKPSLNGPYWAGISVLPERDADLSACTNLVHLTLPDNDDEPLIAKDQICHV